MPPSSIVVLGGGLTGLSSAFHLARRFPFTRITLLERQNIFGGWARSKRVTLNVPEGGQASVLLESGPRTLRPAGKSVLELVNLLNLSSSVVTVPSSAPAARNRFLHLPGVPGLQPIPFSRYLLRTLLPAVLRDALRGDNSPGKGEDESVDSFLSRRFGADFARMFGSALVHGIYAADSRILSMRAAFPALYDSAERGKGSVFRGMVLGAFRRSSEAAKEIASESYDLGSVPKLMKDVSVYSFKDGIGTLVQAMENELRSRDNVQVMAGDGIESLSKQTESEFKVETSSGKTFTASHLVSALPLHILHDLLVVSPKPSSLSPLPHLTANPRSSVCVVNLVFSSTSSHALHPPGFGYLVPRPEAGYNVNATDDEGLGILGTVFDSSALAQQDVYSNPKTRPLVKMTVMLGGPHFTSTATAIQSSDFIPTLLVALAKHLSPSHPHLPLPDPLYSNVQVHDACIPTPTVGHQTLMTQLGEAVTKSWGREAEVIGAGVGGVSVPDCIEAGRKVGRNW